MLQKGTPTYPGVDRGHLVPFRTLGEVFGEQLGSVVDDTVAVAVQHQEAVAAAYPAGALGGAVGVDQAGGDRRGEARIVQLDRVIVAAGLPGGVAPAGADLDPILTARRSGALSLSFAAGTKRASLSGREIVRIWRRGSADSL